MIIVNKRNVNHIGGVEIILRQMLEALQDKDVVVVTLNNAPKTEYGSYGTIPVEQLGTRFCKQTFRWAKDLRKRLQSLSTEHDTIIYHYPSFQPEFYQVPFQRKIVYYHADVTRHRFLGVLYQRLITRRFLQDADIILVSNPNIIESSKTLRVYRDKCQVLHFGIDEVHFRYREDHYRNRLLQKDEDKILLFVGRMARYKGFNYILQSLHMLDSTFRLVVISKDDYRKEDEIYIRQHKLAQRITKVSNVRYEELPYYYSSADILLMPSTDRAEAFGLVAVEAMACSVPVITTELGTGTSYHNVDGITGRVIPPSSAQALTDSIHEVIKWKIDRSILKERANMFSLSAFYERFMAVLDDSKSEY